VTAKEQLRQLVDELSEAEAAVELKRWSERRSGLGGSTGSTPVHDQPLTDEDEATLAKSYDELASGGRPMSVDELHRLG
jgi:hypothetical protein